MHKKEIKWTSIEGEGEKIDAAIVRVHYLTAIEWVKNALRNRTTKNRITSRIATDIEAKRYMLNGEPLIFNEEFKLMDGKHRLEALIKIKGEQIFLLLKNISTDTLETIDTGTQRSLGDVFQMKEIRNAKLLSRTSKNLFIWDTKKKEIVETGYTKSVLDCPSKEIWNFYQKNKLEIDDGCEIFKTHTDISKAFTGSVLSFCFIILARINKSRAYEFFGQLKSKNISTDWKAMKDMKNDIMDITRARLKEWERINYIFSTYKSIYHKQNIEDNLRKQFVDPNATK